LVEQPTKSFGNKPWERKENATMNEKNRNNAIESRDVCYNTLDQWVRFKIQGQLQQILEEEVDALLSRKRHERREKVSPIDPPRGSRNGKLRHVDRVRFGWVTVLSGSARFFLSGCIF